VGRAGLGQGYDGGNSMLSAGPASSEETIMEIFEVADESESSHMADPMPHLQLLLPSIPTMSEHCLTRRVDGTPSLLWVRL